MSDQLKGLIVTFIGVLFVVPDALFVRLISADPMTIAFWRLALVGAGVALWYLLREGVPAFRAVFATGWYGLVYMAGVGLSGLLFVLAVSLTSVAHVVLIIAALPVFAAVYSRVILGEPIHRRMVLTMIAVAAGLAIIAFGVDEGTQASWKGDLLALSVAALFAAALTAARCVRHTNMVPGMAVGYLFAALAALPFAAPLSVPVNDAPLVMAHAGLILLSSVLLALGPRYITSAEIGLLILLESVCAPLLAWAVINEHPGQSALIGGGIVVGALAVSNILGLRRGPLRS